jgi:myo-inositol-1(or 4)-monophosphatase
VGDLEPWFYLDEEAGPDDLLADLAATALAAAREASRVLSAGTAAGGAVTGLDTKISATDMVSDVDRGAEAAVAKILAERRPNDGVLAEEGTQATGSSGVRWVVDPLDGTTNYLFGIPQYAVSVAAEVDGEVVVGVVLDPSRTELWTAARGHGSWLNGRPCRVAAGRSPLDRALCATGFGYRPERRRWQGQVVARMLPEVRDIRRFGSAALDLCWTGGGRYDAYFEWGLNPWDRAAGALVAEEAGATVGVVGRGLVVAAPPGLWDPLCALLERCGAFDAPPGPEPQLA